MIIALLIAKGSFGSSFIAHSFTLILSAKRVTKSQTTELKVMKKPSFEIQVLMTGICILLDVKPKRSKVDGKFVDDYWS